MNASIEAQGHLQDRGIVRLILTTNSGHSGDSFSPYIDDVCVGRGTSRISASR